MEAGQPKATVTYNTLSPPGMLISTYLNSTLPSRQSSDILMPELISFAVNVHFRVHSSLFVLFSSLFIVCMSYPLSHLLAL